MGIMRKVKPRPKKTYHIINIAGKVLSPYCRALPHVPGLVFIFQDFHNSLEEDHIIIFMLSHIVR